MTLQQMVYFVSACRHGNISRAAEEFAVSQPTVSTAIKNLENEFGLCLIKRCRAGFVLTPEGEEFRKLAESLIEHADSVEGVMRTRGKNRHSIRLGVPPMVAAILFPKIYTDFCGKHSDIDVFTREMGREELLELLNDNQLDMAFLPHTERFSQEYISVPVMPFEAVCCVGKGHRLANSECITPTDLEGEPLILFQEGFLMTERILKTFDENEVEPKVMYRSSQLSTIEQFISSELAVGFLFRELASEKKEMVPISFEPQIFTQISLVLRRDSYITDGMRRFIEYIEENYKECEGYV